MKSQASERALHFSVFLVNKLLLIWPSGFLSIINIVNILLKSTTAAYMQIEKYSAKGFFVCVLGYLIMKIASIVWFSKLNVCTCKFNILLNLYSD